MAPLLVNLINLQIFLDLFSTRMKSDGAVVSSQEIKYIYQSSIIKRKKFMLIIENERNQTFRESINFI